MFDASWRLVQCRLRAWELENNIVYYAGSKHQAVEAVLRLPVCWTERIRLAAKILLLEILANMSITDEIDRKEEA